MEIVIDHRVFEMHAHCAGLPEPFELEYPLRWQIAVHCGSGSWPWVGTTRYLLRLDMTFLRTTRERHRDCVQNSSQARCLFRLSAQPNMYMHICMYVVYTCSEADRTRKQFIILSLFFVHDDRLLEIITLACQWPSANHFSKVRSAWRD